MAFDQTVGGMVSLVVSLLILTTITVVLRFTVRKKQKIALGIDDWCILPAWLCFIGLIATACYGMANYFIAFPTSTDKSFLDRVLPAFVRIYWTANLLGTIALAFTRISAIFFYRRIFVTRRKWDAFDMITVCAIAVICLWTIAFVFFQIFNCGDRFEKLFDARVSLYCTTYPYLRGLVISSFLLDLLVVIMPIPKIWTLHTSRRHKIGISAVFLLAVAGVAASCTRMVIVNKNLSRPGGSAEPFLANTRIMYCLILEVGLCLAAANLPSIWYLFRGTTPEKVLKSVRSFISLRSYQSSGESLKHDIDDGSSSNYGIVTTQKYIVEFEPEQSKNENI